MHIRFYSKNEWKTLYVCMRCISFLDTCRMDKMVFSPRSHAKYANWPHLHTQCLTGIVFFYHICYLYTCWVHVFSTWTIVIYSNYSDALLNITDLWMWQASAFIYFRSLLSPRIFSLSQNNRSIFSAAVHNTSTISCTSYSKLWLIHQIRTIINRSPQCLSAFRAQRLH